MYEKLGNMRILALEMGHIKRICHDLHMSIKKITLLIRNSQTVVIKEKTLESTQCCVSSVLDIHPSV